MRTAQYIASCHVVWFIAFYIWGKSFLSSLFVIWVGGRLTQVTSCGSLAVTYRRLTTSNPIKLVPEAQQNLEVILSVGTHWWGGVERCVFTDILLKWRHILYVPEGVWEWVFKSQNCAEFSSGKNPEIWPPIWRLFVKELESGVACS